MFEQFWRALNQANQITENQLYLSPELETVARIAYLAGIDYADAVAGNYSADRLEYPTQVIFRNGRSVSLGIHRLPNGAIAAHLVIDRVESYPPEQLHSGGVEPPQWAPAPKPGDPPATATAQPTRPGETLIQSVDWNIQE